MEVKEIFGKIGETVKQSVENIDGWKKAILYIKKLSGNTGFDSSYIDSSGEEIKIDTTANYYTHKAIGELYKITQTQFPKHKNWNRAIFTLFPNNKFEIEYIWDQELQDQVDGYNNETKPIA